MLILNRALPKLPKFQILGVLLVGSLDFNFWGSYMTYNKEAQSLTFRRGSEVAQHPQEVMILYRFGV